LKVESRGSKLETGMKAISALTPHASRLKLQTSALKFPLSAFDLRFQRFSFSALDLQFPLSAFQISAFSFALGESA
jgi:hypothetical protein